jgi:hypothetical protein
VKFFCAFLVVVVLAGCATSPTNVGLTASRISQPRAIRATLDVDPELRVDMQLIPVVDWPVIDISNTVPADGSENDSAGTISVICYTGPACVLTVSGLGDRIAHLESSTNLEDWLPYPTAAWKRKFYGPDCLSCTNSPIDPFRFFRVVITQ